MWVCCFAHLLSEVLRLVQHDLALARVMRVLVAMHMAIELAAQHVFGRFDGNLRFLSLIAFAVGRPFLTVVLESFVLVLKDGVSALKFIHCHGGGW